MMLIPFFMTYQNRAEAEEKSNRVYIASRTQTPVIVDGLLEEESWRTAQSLVLRDNKTGSAVSDSSRLTVVKSCFDHENLYIGFICYDSDIWGNFTKRDQHLWTEEAVEVFIDVDDKPNTYIEIDVSPNNVLFDSYIVNPVDIDVEATSKFDLPHMKTAVSVDGTINKRDDIDLSWTVEIVIPFRDMIKDFNVDTLGEAKWKVNFYRIDRGPEVVFHYAWSPTGGRFHQPSVFGMLLFK